MNMRNRDKKEIYEKRRMEKLKKENIQAKKKRTIKVEIQFSLSVIASAQPWLNNRSYFSTKLS